MEFPPFKKRPEGARLDGCRVDLDGPVDARGRIEGCLPLPEKTVQGCPAVGLDEQLGAFDIHQAHEGHGHGIEDPDILGSHAEA